MSPSNMISTLFDREKPSIIADSEDFLRECALLGFSTANITELQKLPKNSIVFSFSNDAAKKTFELAKNTESKKSVFCATQVFEPTTAIALYSLNLLLSSNFERALHTQRSVLNMLNSNEKFFLSGNDADAQVSISPHAQPYALLAEDVSGDFVQSVAEFFEVHYAHMDPQELCPFSFSGTLKIAGILTVLRKPNPKLPEGLKTPLKWLSDQISKDGALLSIEDNTITSLQVNNEEHVKLLDLAAGSRGLKLTEFAIGVNEAIASNIDYRINSQMNEGISGIHLAIGDGSSGYHIDFLSPAVSVYPEN
ncbi:hypothetical protein ACK3BE_09985 [Pseudomonas mandelii]|uniref:Crocagin biosynthetic protein CgnE/B domain-containing protein n=1 Tax=Pseudomonas fluorescens TaxID=294 RepID=A0A5E7GCS3_PSEFL|nr:MULTISPECIES: hypothetical protein [Pseudomonas]OOL36557.1 hypothetical protein BOO94_17490 [Pseudomonas sp. FSL W5-0299]VVO46703.1 hypothetical protein PS870_00074 [Pseudomonas fluorescens]